VNNLEGVEPKKTLGQHWLNDETVLQSIVDAADVNSDDYVLEIGPGTGNLTDYLHRTGANVLALEFDKELISKLIKKYSKTEKITIKHGDIRTFNFSKLPKKYKVVANIPYYLTSHLIRSLSETDNPPDIAVLLIQKEVAERICAKPGQMGILSITAQFYFECSLNVEVSADLFTPPPKVDSQVVVLKRRSKFIIDVNEKLFFGLVKAGFSNKRKTLANSLSGGLRISKSEGISLLNSAGVDSGLRAQQLSFDQWHSIYREHVKGN